MRDQFFGLGVGPSARGEMEFVTDQFAFILDMPLRVAILQRSCKSEAVRTAGAFGDGVVELRDAYMAGNGAAFLFQIEVGAARCAVGQRRCRYPIAGEVSGCTTRGSRQYEERAE